MSTSYPIPASRRTRPVRTDLEWGPAKHRREDDLAGAAAQQAVALQEAIDQRDGATARPDDN